MNHPTVFTIILVLVLGSGPLEILANSRFFSVPALELAAKVLDEAGEPVPLGNAMLLAPQDSSLLQGIVFTDGALHFTTLEQLPVLLHITALGYEPFYQLLTNDGQSLVDLGNIKLKTLALTEVVVRANRPLVEQRGSDLVVHVDQTNLSSLGTAFEVLRSTPKVMVSSGSQVSVLGKGQALIYLNEQLILSNDLLNSLAASDIKRIEIIENPGAAYDAAGKAVINIITKKGRLEGYRLGLKEELTHGRYFRHYSQANAYYRVGDLLLQGGYGYREAKWQGRNLYGRIMEMADRVREVDNTFVYRPDRSTHDFNLRASWQFGEQQTIGLQYFGTRSDALHQSSNHNIFSVDNAWSYDLFTDIAAPNDQQNNTLSGFYQLQLDTLGSSLRLGGQYADVNSQRNERITQLYFGADGTNVEQFKFSQNRSAIQLETAQADWVKILSNGQSLSLGGKYAHIQNRSALDFQNQAADGSITIDPYFSNSYDYDETIWAAYAEWNRNTEQWQLQLGLRTEWTQTGGLAGGGITQELFQRNYWNVFPSVSIGKQVNEHNRVQLSYNSRIQRPTFRDLNPFVWYADSLTALQGNAELLPERSEVFDLSWQHRQWNWQLSYVHARNTINTLIEIRNPEDPAIFTFLRDNLRQMNNVTLTLSRGFQFGKYGNYNMLGLRSEHHQYEDEGRLVTNSTNGWYLYTSHTLQLPAQLKFETSFTYHSKRVDGIYTDNPVYFWHLGLSRKFFQDQLTVRLYSNDILDSYRFIGVSSVVGNDWTYLSEGDWQFIQLSLYWEMGKLNTNALQERKIGKAELERM